MPKSMRLPVALTLSALQVFFPALSHSAATDLSDIPMAVVNSVKPNIMLTIDDSGSMQFEAIPESDDVYFTFPRANPLYGNLWGYGTNYDSVARFEHSDRYARYFRTARFNPIYYDPTKRYTPWSNSDGSIRSNATPSAAWHNPETPAEGTLDLTTNQTWNVAWRNDDGTESTASRTFYPATYFVYTGATNLTGPTDVGNIQASFTLVEIKSTTSTYNSPKPAGRTDCVTNTNSCTYSEEIQNFANWYSYYRSRILAARAGIGKAFSKQLSDSMRVGFGAINKGSTSVDGVNTATVISGVRLFQGTDRTAFFNSLYGHAMPSAGTPLRKAMGDVGEYFSRTDNAGPWGETPGSSTGTQFACRQNYHILMTDGYWNGTGSTNGTGNQDNTNGSLISRPTGSTQTPTSFQYTAGNPYSDAHSNTLADTAMYYWKTDLRPTMDNIVPDSTKNPAFWQHMVNFTVGFGVTGTISKSTIDAAFTTSPPSITWPDPTATLANTIDDLAHAAINSRGGFYSAADPDTFSSALSSAIDDAVARSGAAAAVAVSNANVTSGDNASYASSYNSGSWTGDLQSYPIDLTTGIPNTATPNWASSAQTQLNSKTSATRNIVTYSGTSGSGEGRRFQASGCSPTSNCISSPQQSRLATPYSPPGTSDGAAVVAYLRGDRSGESSSIYRSRLHLLGDIINSEAVIIREPMASYADQCYNNAVPSVCSQSFVKNQASRTQMIAQGANDGFLHFFNAATGAESWAYLPNALINMSDPANSGTSTLNILTRRNSFAHKYFVDGTPTVGDVDFSNTDGGTGNPDWRTIVVGGLGKGGRGYYALDVTNPAATSEADAASKVLWEFPNSTTSSTIKANIGYTYGKPIVTKTAAYGWVVLVTSGYNNGTGTDNSGGDGHGYLWVLNARTGEVLQTIDTGAGTTGTPSGLTHIAGWTDNGSIDNTTTYAYGGDLLGNVWRFDLTDDNGGITYTKQRIATLRSGSSVSSPAQPITTVPELAGVTIGGALKRFIYVGTGQYLGSSDVDNNQTQTMYALVDNLSTPSSGDVIADPVRSSLVAQTLTTSGTTRTISNNAINFATQKGWYIDLPGCSVGSCPGTGSKGSERINTDPLIVTGLLIFTSNIPNSADPCAPGGSSYLNIVDYQTGGTVTGTTASISLGNTLSSRPVPIKLPSGEIKVLIRKSDATTYTGNIPPQNSPATARRITWRELTE